MWIHYHPPSVLTVDFKHIENVSDKPQFAIIVQTVFKTAQN